MVGIAVIHARSRLEISVDVLTVWKEFCQVALE